MKKKINKTVVVLVTAALALLALWLRENEMRVAAQTKLQNFQYKSTSALNEKGDAIADLSTQLGELQAVLQRTTDEANNAISDRDAQIQKLNEDAQRAMAENAAAIEEKNKNIGALEAEMKEDADRYDGSLKKKNTELSEMGEQLRKSTERLASALKDKEKAESENYDLQQQVSTLERRVEKVNEDNKRLEGLAKVCDPTDPAGLADGPQNPA